MHHLLHEAAARLEARHIEEARLDAELLLAAACGQTRAWLLAHGDAPLNEAQSLRFAGFVERRARHEPVAYILGHKEFYGLDLLVDRRVLIPRPETETLVDEALAWLRRPSARAATESARQAGLSVLSHTVGGMRTVRNVLAWSSEAFRPQLFPDAPPLVEPSERGSITVIDIGTGSGAIALALAAHTPPDTVRLIAGDVSPDALAVAGANAARHGLSGRITFVQSDLLLCIDSHIDTRAGLIVANLPYVARAEWAELAPDISAYEPHLALDGGADGLDLFRRFFAQAPAHLAPGGMLLLEIGWQQAAAVRSLAQDAFPQAQVDIVQDLAGQDRVALIGTHHVR